MRKGISMEMTTFELHIFVANKMIADSTEIMGEAIKEKNWLRAGELESYIEGMRQVLIVFSGGLPDCAR